MKGILSFGILVTAAVSVFGQGQINFNNRVLTATPPIDAKIYDNSSFPPNFLNGTDRSFRAALLGGPTTATPASPTNAGTLGLLASPTTGATWVGFRTGTLAGYVNVGTDSARDSGLPFGTLGLFQVVIWQGTATTWAQAYTDWQAGRIKVGSSYPLTLPTTQNATDLNVPVLQGLQSFSFWIPEPSSFALLGVGVAAMLIFRRRR